MEKERLAEYLEQYHMGALNAATSREFAQMGHLSIKH